MISRKTRKYFLLILLLLERIGLSPWKVDRKNGVVNKAGKWRRLYWFTTAAVIVGGEIGTLALFTFNVLTKDVSTIEIFMFISLACVMVMFLTIIVILTVFLDESQTYLNRLLAFNKRMIESFAVGGNDMVLQMLVKAMPTISIVVSIIAAPGCIIGIELKSFRNLMWGLRHNLLVSTFLGGAAATCIFINWQIINICVPTLLMHFKVMMDVSKFNEEGQVPAELPQIWTNTKQALYRSLQILHNQVMHIIRYSLTGYFAAAVFLAISQIYLVVKSQDVLPMFAIAGILSAAILTTFLILLFTQLSWQMTESSESYRGETGVVLTKTEDDKFRRSCFPLRVTVPYIFTVKDDTTAGLMQFMLETVVDLLLT